ncbi:MAG: SDR family NAD(P)-dependent oxidoreductase [Solirubrobacteraceae bacterium]
MSSLRGRTVLVTGANSGLGLAASAELAARGAEVVLACRDPERGTAALDTVRARCSGASPQLVALDLAELASVRRAAAEVAARWPRLDVLVNNAGYAGAPGLTSDGFERHLGVNHLGHFLLTASLWPLLLRVDRPRVVTVSSLGHFVGRIPRDLAAWRRPGRPGLRRYADSKLANLVFAFELDRRAKAAGLAVASVGVHPGMTRSGLGVGSGGRAWEALVSVSHRVICQPMKDGVKPHVLAVTDPSLRGGEYVGPGGPLGARGPARHPVAHLRAAADAQLGKQLWALSEQLTSTQFDVGPRAADRSSTAPHQGRAAVSGGTTSTGERP